MPEPRYDARTVTTPDGECRITVAYKPGSAVEHMTDAQFLAEFHSDKMRRTVTPVDDDSGFNGTINKLAEERLRRHPPGAPYTADEIAPLLDDSDNHDQAARIAALLNIIIERVSPDSLD